jgi:hypothetical protein
MKLPNILHENVFAISNVLPAALKLEEYIDYDLQFDKTFISPLEIILKEIGWSSEKKPSLEGFFA